MICQRLAWLMERTGLLCRALPSHRLPNQDRAKYKTEASRFGFPFGCPVFLPVPPGPMSRKTKADPSPRDRRCGMLRFALLSVPWLNTTPDRPSEFDARPASRFPWIETVKTISARPRRNMGAPKVEMHDAIMQMKNAEAARVRSTREFSALAPSVSSVLAASPSPIRSGSLAAPIFNVVAAGRIHTIGARPRRLGRMTLRPALRGGRRPGDILNGKQDACRRDPPRGNSGRGRERPTC